jgi:hypothetical protein
MESVVKSLRTLLTLAIGVAAFPTHATLSTSFSLDGYVGAEVAGFAAAGLNNHFGTLSLNTVPAGATIEKAFLYTNNYFAPGATPTAVFNANNLGSTAALATNNGFSTFRWDVTSLVTGNGSFSASYAGAIQGYGMALAVVYSDAGLPMGRAVIADGAFDLFAGSNPSTTLSGLGGPGTLWVHTGADNGGSGEVVSMNGNAVGGPLNNNIGQFASLLQMPVSTIAGPNTVDILSPVDRFGWDLAVMTSASPIPEAGTIGFVTIGLACIAGGRLIRRLRS